jgi:tRNA threonylcarbamoyladenosine biosynthesis protein TsaE
MKGDALTLLSSTPEDTRLLGKLIGQLLSPGDVLLLFGPLGCGKTTLVKGIAEGLGVSQNHVISPTFTLIAEYRGRITLYHVDLYRLERPDEAVALGLTDYLYSDSGATVIEWADRLPPGLVEDALSIALQYAGDDLRLITVTPSGPHSLDLLRALHLAARRHRVQIRQNESSSEAER